MACGLLCFMGTALASPYDGGPFAHHSSWHHPAPVYHAWGWPGFYYNSFDPWWVTNVYGPVRTTYYWFW